MSIDALKDEILKLSEADQAELRAWLLHQEWDDWDRQMAEDFAPGGRGEHLLRQAEEDFRTGATTPLAEGLRKHKGR